MHGQVMILREQFPTRTTLMRLHLLMNNPMVSTQASTPRESLTTNFTFLHFLTHDQLYRNYFGRHPSRGVTFVIILMNGLKMPRERLFASKQFVTYATSVLLGLAGMHRVYMYGQVLLLVKPLITSLTLETPHSTMSGAVNCKVVFSGEHLLTDITLKWFDFVMNSFNMSSHYAHRGKGFSTNFTL